MTTVLPYAEVNKILTNEELPNVSICIPCYKRQKFIPLILCNIRCMDYPLDKIEVNILQDGPEPLFTDSTLENFKKQIAPATLQYKYEKDIRRTIGEKRNRLVKSSQYKHIAMMDSDDIYMPTYLRYSISALKQYKVGITTSAAMLFIYPDLDYKITGIRCGSKIQGHEACCVFTKKHFGSMGGFISKGNHGNQGEGVKMISYNEKQMVNLDIHFLMCCVAHSGEEGNTIDKQQFNKSQSIGQLQNLPHIEVLKGMFQRYND